MPSPSSAAVTPKGPSSALRACAGLAFVLLAVTCGGGGHSGSSYSSPALGTPLNPFLPSPYPSPNPSPSGVAPFSSAYIYSFAPQKATAYSQVELWGWGLLGATQVTFGGVQATVFSTPDDKTLRVGVPPGAKSGPIAVTTLHGLVQTSGSFTFDPSAPPPSFIHGLIPSSGPVATLVRVRGTGLFGTTGVAFGGVPAVLQAGNSDSEVAVTVPTGAKSGPVTLTLPTGATVASSLPFTVTTGPIGAPVLNDYTPKTGGPGTSLALTGVNLETVSGVTLGGKPVEYFVWGDTSLVAWVPNQGAASGDLAVISPSGTASHPSPFTLVESAPAIRTFFPQSGPDDSRVFIFGSNLLSTTGVKFGNVASPWFRVISNWQVEAMVPAKATQGPVSILSGQGVATSTRSFTVTPEIGSLAVGIAGMYVTQATQDQDNSVPLVANKDAVARIFLLANRYNRVTPPIQVTLLDAKGAPLLTREVRGTDAGVPERMDEGSRSASWNLTIPGNLIQPGISLSAKVLPVADLALPAEGVSAPEDGLPLALNVVTVPPIGITIVPIISALGTGNVSKGDRTLESWTSRFQAIYPIDAIDLKEGQPITTKFDLSGGIEQYISLRNQLDVLRLQGDRQRYFYGVFIKPFSGNLLGLGNFPPTAASTDGRTAIGYDTQSLRDGESYPEVFAHEMGHCLGRRHAPCGPAGGPDKAYPYPKGALGSFGMDVRGNRVLDPHVYSDVMGYCSPQWISDYTYKGVLNWRNLQAAGLGAGQMAALQALPGLLVWGQVNEGVVTLEPAFDVQAALDPPGPGDYLLQVLDRHGAVLGQQSFAPRDEPDLPADTRVASFAFILPMTPLMQEGMASLRVQRGGVTLATRASTSAGSMAAHPAAAVLQREPVATAWGEGRVLLTWDAARHPAVTVKDAATGQSIALAEGGEMTLVTEARDLILTFTDGLRTVTRQIQVR